MESWNFGIFESSNNSRAKNTTDYITAFYDFQEK